MSGEAIGVWVQQGLLAWLAALAALAVWKLTRRADLLTGFLVNDPRNAGQRGRAEPDRVQLMVAFALVVGGYLLEVARTLAAADGAVVHMPDAPESILTMLAGSQAIYVSGKLARSLQG